MLEGLKDVQWAELSHAYGSASDVPEILQALAADDEGERKGAIGTFFSNIYHQGSVYQASAYAVPFLLELLAHNSIQGKDGILSLLAHMAIGDGYYYQNPPLSRSEPSLEDGETDLQSALQWEIHKSLSSEKIYGSDYQQKREEELFWINKTHSAIVEGAELYFALLEHPDIQIKTNAASLLVRLPELSERVLPLFYTLFEKEEDEHVKANLVALLGRFDKQNERSYHLFKHLALDESAPILRFVASLSIVRSRREDIPHEAINFLIQVATDNIIIDQDRYNQIPAEEWKTSFASLYALQWLEDPLATYAIHQLVSAFHVYLRHFEEENGFNLQQYNSSKDFCLAWNAREGTVIETPVAEDTEDSFDWLGNEMFLMSDPITFTVEQICQTLVLLAFRNKRLKHGKRFSDLSPEQQLVLTTLLNCSLAWHRSGSYRDQATDQVKDEITCVANLDQIGLSNPFPDKPQREELRAFIEQKQGVGDWQTDQYQHMMEMLHLALKERNSNFRETDS